MATKASADGDVHAYFSTFESPFDAYMTFAHVVSDLCRRLDPESSVSSPDSRAFGVAARRG